MTKTSIGMRLICAVVVLVACVVVFSASVEAKTNFANGRDKVVTEKPCSPESEAKAACCENSDGCHASKKKSLVKKLGDRITGIFAFGDRVNHGLTDWLLSDKRERAQESQGRP